MSTYATTTVHDLLARRLRPPDWWADVAREVASWPHAERTLASRLQAAVLDAVDWGALAREYLQAAEAAKEDAA